MATPNFVGSGLGGTIVSTNEWIQQDLTTWALTDGAVTGLVTSVTSTQIVIADKVANTTPSDWSRFSGPELLPNKRYELKWIRKNAGQYDSVGVCVGAHDIADESPRFAAGQFEAGTAQNHFGALEGGYWQNTSTDIETVIVTFITDDSSNIYGGLSVAFDHSEIRVNSKEQGASLYATTTPRLVAYVRHGAAFGSTSTINYELWVRVSPVM
jgi:hypothetical protein